MTNETDPREEIVARAICKGFGLKPDVILSNARPRWHSYTIHASIIFAALDAAPPAEPTEAEVAERLPESDRMVALRIIERQQAEIARLKAGRDHWYMSDLKETGRATAAEVEVADLRARLEEAVTKANNFLHNAEEADAEVTQLTIERDVLRARLATFLAHADQCQTSVARGVGGMTVDANMRATRVHVSQWEIEELRTALAAIKEDRT